MDEYEVMDDVVVQVDVDDIVEVVAQVVMEMIVEEIDKDHEDTREDQVHLVIELHLIDQEEMIQLIAGD